MADYQDRVVSTLRVFEPPRRGIAVTSGILERLLYVLACETVYVEATIVTGGAAVLHRSRMC